MKVYKTAAKEADVELTQLLGHENRLYKASILDEFSKEAIRLACTYDEFKLLLFEKYQYRPAYKINETDNSLTLPVLFALIESRDIELSRKIQVWKQEHSKSCIWDSSFYRLNRPLSTYARSKMKDLLHLDAKLMLEAIKDLEELKHLSLNDIHLIQKAIDSLMIRLKELEIEVELSQVIGLLCLDSKAILEAIHHTEWTGFAPKYFVEHKQKKSLSINAIIRILFMLELGFDVVILSPNHYTSVQSYLPDSSFDRYLAGASLGKQQANLSGKIRLAFVLLLVLALLYYFFR